MRARQLTSKCYQLVDFSLTFVSRILFSITLRVYTNRSSNTRSVQTNFHPLKITRIKFLAITNDREKEKGMKERKNERKANKVHRGSPGILIRIRLPSRVSRILESWSSGLPLPLPLPGHQCAGPKLRERSRANTRERSAHDVDEYHSTTILKPPVHRA